jgi:tocopherol O-methyltransferase
MTRGGDLNPQAFVLFILSLAKLHSLAVLGCMEAAFASESYWPETKAGLALAEEHVRFTRESSMGFRSSASRASYTDAIVRYYERTWFDYRFVWVSNRNYLGMHWGYWDENTKSHSESLVNMNKAVGAFAGLEPGMRVLDAGCGVGGPSTWIAETYGVNVVGVTLSGVQVAKARRNARRRHLEDRVQFAQQDFTDLTFSDESFDVVWSQEAVCHSRAEDKQKFLAEAHRVLRPGGRLVVEDWFRRGRSYSENDERLMKDMLSGLAIEDLATGEEFASWAAAAGFRDVGLHDVTAHAVPSMRRLSRLALACYGPGLFLRALQIRSAVQHGNLRAARLQWPAHTRDLWFIAILAARKSGSGGPPSRHHAARTQSDTQPM